jgi:Zn-dependent peptidase ImmA (M78 family)/O-acetyl-ADP-ribose deacetylase (regulator of RNase III)
MKPRRESSLTNDELQRELQEVFRKKHWADVKAERAELADALSTSSQSGVLSVDRALERFDARSRSTAVKRRAYWTHPSVTALEGADPIETIIARARTLVLKAMEAGWNGPPYDPFALAEYDGIRIVPTEDVIDARTYGSVSPKFTIEFNPSRPPARIRYSIAHEIAHTLFSDCAATVRNRATHEQMKADEWQLEMLCNIAASEILIPLGSLGKVREVLPSVKNVLDLRREFQVSFEAMTLRLVRLTEYVCFAFAARYDDESDRYRLDYSVSSEAWRSVPHLEQGFILPKESPASECTAIGYTAQGEEKWLSGADTWSVEYLGIPPYPGEIRPRVIGIASPVEKTTSQICRIRYLKGNALEPRGTGEKVVVQIVNDKAMIWGAGFSRQVSKKWPQAQLKFKDWVLGARGEFKLGNTHVVRVDDSTTVVSLVAQHGFGPSDHPRIRYNALATSLQQVGELANSAGASIHMPRIGAGLAGGSWEVVEEIVEESLCRRGLNVTVYDLPHDRGSTRRQSSLIFDRSKQV